MRIVKNLQDVQKALNELFDWKQKFPDGKSWDFRGNRITNAGNSVNAQDYITRAELAGLVVPLIPQQIQQTTNVFYTILFTPPDGQANGTVSPAYTVGIGRSGTPNQGWVTATGAPSGTALTVNFQYNGVNLLQSDLTLPIGQTTPAVASNFVTPTQQLAQLAQIQLILTNVGGATGVSAGLVIKVIQ